MEIMEPPDPRAQGLIPIVEYAVQRRAAGDPDYWDHATLLELAVLAGDRERAQESLAEAAAAVREPWEPKTTARNVRLIREARDRRGEDVEWLTAIEEQLGRLAEEAPA
jgi:hypothetical protein